MYKTIEELSVIIYTEKGAVRKRYLERDLFTETFGLDSTNYIDSLYPNDYQFHEKVYLYLTKRSTPPSCRHCKKRIELKSHDTLGYKYNDYCDLTCMRLDPLFSQKSVIKNLEKIYNISFSDVSNFIEEFYKEEKEIPLKQKFYLFQNKIKFLPLCKVCGKKTSFQDKERGYGECCSSKCSSVYLEQQKKRFGLITDEKEHKYKVKYLEKHDIGIQEFNSFLQKYKYIELNFQEQIYLYLHNIIEYPICETCGSKSEYISEKLGYKKYCSKVCFQKSDSFSTYREENMEKSYEKYMNLISTEFTHSISLEEYKKNYETHKYDFTCNQCQSKFKDYLNYNGLPRCLKCNPINSSLEEKKILEFLLSHGIEDIKTCDRTILYPLELDFYIPEKKLAIEYNGLMWHSFGKSKSIRFTDFSLEKEKRNNHLGKTEGCERQDIQLLHIFENEWVDSIKQDIWKSIIQNKLGKTPYKHFARKTIVREVSNNETKQFLTENHLQGYVPSSINLGLYSTSGELLQIMTFGKSRYSKKSDYEMYRAASKKYTTIVGGSSKLFKYFVNNYLKTNESIVTYADRRYSQGKVYIELGFQFQGISESNYFYFKEGSIKLESRVKYQKHKLEGILERYDSTLTESENMYNNGYRKIYDSGNITFIYRSKKL